MAIIFLIQFFLKAQQNPLRDISEKIFARWALGSQTFCTMQPTSILLLLLGLFAFGAELALTSGRPEFCHLLPNPGPCRAVVPRYFYNPKSNRCEKFIYGGCHGNKNNFETLKDCHYTCVEKPGTCPIPPDDLITICPVKCVSDWACPGKEKCCSWGCMVDCMSPK
uniref:BPTI/Kunitz inhibitor domain-containing protein n=1 Tax=Anolis carolinensis TaxID=28377 RepID=L7MZN8_ANOCA|nr:PREDICTED: chelonianin-like [Anolis carolinensis]|eukprot:XP_016852535.1 PREDICTED: chelonianin-like [Anolis carolinensis]